MDTGHYDPFDFDEQSLEDREKERRIAAEEERDDIKWAMGSKRGRRFVWRFLEQAGIFRSSFSNDPLQMAFNEGNRNNGSRLLAMIHECCPEQYIRMTKERAHGRRRD